MFLRYLFVTLRLSAKELLQCIGSSKSDILLLYYTGVTEASSGSWVTITASGPHLLSCLSRAAGAS
jgi:hypothetical protein